MTLTLAIVLCAWVSGYAAGRYHSLRIERDRAYSALVKHIELELDERHRVVVAGPKRPLRLLRRVK